MDYEKLAVAIKLCGSTPKVDQCPQCPYWASGDMNNCIPRVTADAATAITDLLARAEAAEKKATELDKALFDAAKVVRTMQERTIPYYRNRTESAEKEVEWKNKVIEAAERRFVEAEARAEKAAVAFAKGTDKMILDAIIQKAKENGITDLYALNEDFILSAIKEKMEGTRDVSHVAHAKWVNNKTRTVCSKCGVRAATESDETGYYQLESNYCPNCGAKMDAET